MKHQTGSARIAALWLLIASLLLASPAWANLSATVDRTEITDADLLKLTIRLENTTTASAPNFQVLERDFEIVQRSGPNQSSRISIINGRQSSEVQVSWELRLRPKRLGTLEIPAFRVGSYVSRPIRIEVRQQSAAMKRKMSQLVFFDTSVDTKETYVQGQIIYTIKLYYLENISGDFPPAPAVPDAVIETIESEKRYDAITNGRRYYVLEKRYGIYPQKSGELVIPAQTFSGFRAGPGFFSTREPILTRSESHTISVKPKPNAFPGDHWLPATDVTLEETWVGGPPQFTVGEPVNRSIQISAEGVAASLLPPLQDTAIEGAKTYQDPPAEEQTLTPTGINASQTIVIGIVPTRAGELRLPEIQIPWWNTRTDSLETARIPAQTFQVAPAPGQTGTSVVPQTSATPITSTGAATASATNVTQQYWQPIAIALFVLWLLTLVFWYLSARKSRPVLVEKSEIQVPDQRQILKSLKQACTSRAAGEAQALLIRWGNARFGNIRSLQALIHRVADPDLEQTINQLESSLYAPQASQDWRGDDLWRAVQRLEKRSIESPASNRQLLAGLNPGGR